MIGIGLVLNLVGIGVIVFSIGLGLYLFFKIVYPRVMLWSRARALEIARRDLAVRREMAEIRETQRRIERGKGGLEIGKIILWFLLAASIIIVVWWIAIPLGLKVISTQIPLPLGVEPIIAWLARFIFVIYVLIRFPSWFRSCFVVVGSVEIPHQAVLVRLGRAIGALSPGLHFILRPFEDLKNFPTGEYTLFYQIHSGLYSKEAPKKHLSSQPMEVDIGFYFRWPMANKIYSFPIPKDQARRTLPPGEEPQTAPQLREGFAFGRVPGTELLTKAYYRLPIKDLMSPGATDELGRLFERGVMGGTRHTMSDRTSWQCRAEQPEIEVAIKNYLISEEGNPVFECGIPRECVSIELPRVKFPQDTEEAWREPEKARKRAEAAGSKKQAITKELEAYIEKGTPEEIAALIVGGGIEGKGMTMEQLRDLKILEALGGFGKTSSKEFSKRELIDKLKKLSTSERKEILKRL